jgi:hypothetical protein
LAVTANSLAGLINSHLERLCEISIKLLNPTHGSGWIVQVLPKTRADVTDSNPPRGEREEGGGPSPL